MALTTTLRQSVRGRFVPACKAPSVIGNSKRGNARFESLLGMFGLKDRMIEAGMVVDWKTPIDWQRVNAIREKERNRCIELLKESLE